MKKLNLLRPLHNPKVGDDVVSMCNAFKYIVEAVIDTQLCVSTIDGYGYRHAYVHPERFLRQAPLIWLEDTPIYKGDTVYHKHTGQEFKFINCSYDGSICIATNDDMFANISHDYRDLTIDKPKVKMTKWVNIYENSDLAAVHDTKNQAEICTMPGRVACVEVSWEE